MWKFFPNYLHPPDFFPPSLGKLRSSLASDTHQYFVNRISHSGIFLPFLGIFGSKYQYCFLKIKLCTQASLSMSNSIGMFTFSVLNQKYLFQGKFGLKSKNYLFKMKSGVWSNLSMLNSMVMVNFSVSDQKYHFFKLTWSKKIKFSV